MIGILPAAGEAKRMHGIPKYLLPVEGGYLIDIHIRNLTEAGFCNGIYVGARAEDLPVMKPFISSIATITPVKEHWNMSRTVLSLLDQNYDALHNETIVFGMPDTYIEDEYAYHSLRCAVDDWNYDIAVGLFQHQPGQKYGGMCRVENETLVEVVDKPTTTDLTLIWGAIAWRPMFWKYIEWDDPHVGYALARALADGIHIHAEIFNGHYWDCGTPDEYFALIRHLTEER